MKYHYPLNGITAYLMRETRKKDKESECSLRWCVTYKRKRAYYSTGKKLNSTDWKLFEKSEEADFEVKSKALYLKETKKDLSDYFENKLKPAIKKLELNFSLDTLNRELGKSDITTVNDAFRAKIDELINDNKIGNSTIYQSTLHSLVRFKYYKGLKSREAKRLFVEKCVNKRYITRGKNILTVKSDISFSDITKKFLNEWETFLTETGLAHSTIGIQMRTLRSIVNNGGEPYISDSLYPFGDKKEQYLIPEGDRREIALPIEDIWKIENFDTDIHSLILARDIFVFMFYCNGLNFGDLCRLQYSNIKPSTNEIEFVRKKTRSTNRKPTTIYAPLLPPMVEIMNRHGNKTQDGYIFPFLNGIEPTDKNEKQIKDAISLALNPINSALKTIAAQLNIDGNISTAYTRNSYITHLISEMYLNEIFVKQMVGHSTKKDVTAGYNRITPKKRREINSRLLNPDKEYSTIVKINTHAI